MAELFRVAADDPCLDGHFPGDPIVPAVVILDAVVVACERRAVGRVEAIERCRFRARLHPERSCRIELGAVDHGSVRFRCVVAETEIARGRLRVKGAQEARDSLD